MMTTLCMKAVGQLDNGIKAGNGPTYFPNRASLRQNSALAIYKPTVGSAMVVHCSWVGDRITLSLW